ncbi:Developmentally regulated GTP-binding protein 1 [Aduncisulcus paluster]|uniref:Developmentally regulated GTP-binding protein 1 n=1 Tax=Aduncisulcus paluster TaxID=2918883 RepID=A0ABQ5KW83_9EUKA|nr:Developmentally regulated GTP-binding protein 1 [Aduncisulcus paluster]
MSSVEAKIKEIEEEIARTQKNKATESHLCRLRAKLSKLKEELVTSASASTGKGSGFDVSRSGNARVGMIGFPSVGKSTLLTKLTTSKSEVAAYEFTTLTCIPGTFIHNSTRIQLLDLPGIIEGAADNKGRGRQVIGTARTCDLLCIVLDSAKPMTLKNKIEKELHKFGIRVNRTPPDITVKRKKSGGVNFTSTCECTHLNKESVQAVMSELKIPNCDVLVREDSTVDELIDAVEGNRVYLPAVYICNKIDQITIEELDLFDMLPQWIPVCAHHEWNLDELKDCIFDNLKITRVYSKRRKQKADFDDPVILTGKMGAPTVEAFCQRIHKDMVRLFSYAKVWGTSVKFPGQRVGKDHVLHDEDVKLWSEAPIVNSVFVKEGGSYSSPIPRDDPKLVDLSIPIVKCNSARFTKESELYDQSSNAQRMLKGGEFVVFSDLYIPFSSPSTMKGAYICVHRNWSSPTLLFFFTDCDGKKTFKKYEFTRPKHWYEWHFLPIDLPNVISCEIEGKGTWYEKNGLVYSIAGLIFDTTNLRRLFRTSLTHKFSTSKIFPPKIVKRIRHRAVEVSRHVAKWKSWSNVFLFFLEHFPYLSDTMLAVSKSLIDTIGFRLFSTFNVIDADGGKHTVTANDGDSLSAAIQAAGIPLVTACGGNVACGTCHCILDKEHYEKVSAPSEDEADTLEFVDEPTETSRLACAMSVSSELEGATIKIPPIE